MDRERTFELTRRYRNAGKIETYERYAFSLSEPEREEYWHAWRGNPKTESPSRRAAWGEQAAR